MSVDHTHNIVEVHNVSFGYNGTKVLNDIDLNIHKGDYLGVIGPNGGGKTTLIKIILGLLKPASGTVQLFGKPIDQFKDWQKIGYVAQRAINFDQNFPATVKEVVQMGNALEVEWALKHVGMYEFANRLIGDLSGGQQQRVFIARTLAQKPEIIFLDEPTSGVDEETQEQFFNLLDKLNHDLNITLVLISHDIEVLLSEVTEIAFIHQKLRYHGSPKNFEKTKLAGHHH